MRFRGGPCATGLGAPGSCCCSTWSSCHVQPWSTLGGNIDPFSQTPLPLPQAAELVREYVGDWPMMRPLVLVLKLFLQQRELNEVGGQERGS